MPEPVPRQLSELPRARRAARHALQYPFFAQMHAGATSQEAVDAFDAQFALWLEAARAAVAELTALAQDGGAADSSAAAGKLAEALGAAGTSPASTALPACSALCKLLAGAAQPEAPLERARLAARRCAALAAPIRLRRTAAEAVLAAAGASAQEGAAAADGGSKWAAGSLAGAGSQAADAEGLLEAAAEWALSSSDEGARPRLLEELGAVYAEAMENFVAMLSELPGVGPLQAGAKATSALRAARVVPPRVLIVAGSDSGGGAGIQADLKACAALGAFGMTAISALTAQNSQGVQGIFPIPVDFVQQQMRSVFDDLGADVVKTGMLATTEIVKAVAGALRERSQGAAEHGGGLPFQLVVDPVMVSTSGHVLLQDDAIDSLTTELIKMATLITPNLPEARLLLGRPELSSIEDMKQAARDLCALGPRWVLVKGGHLCLTGQAVSVAVDVLCDAVSGECELLEAKLVESNHTHGTGCTLASSIAALLAIGHTVPEAVRGAKAYIAGAIAASAHLALGGGPQGPMNHAWQTAEW